MKGLRQGACLLLVGLATAGVLPPGTRAAAGQGAGTAGVAGAAEATGVPAKAAVCNACHGAQPDAAQPLNPILAGQTSRYLYLQLRDFQAGRRVNEVMTPLVAGMTREEMRELSDYYAARKPPPQPFVPDPEKARIGKLKAEETLCTMCHLGGFAGQNEIPRVAGQNYAYIVKQLADFKARRRTNDGGSMTSVANTMSDEDIENVAHYLAGL